MKKIKLVLVSIALVISLCLITGCTSSDNTNQSSEEKTVAKVLAEQFEDEMKKEKDIEIVANKIAKNEIIKIELDVASIGEEDYLSGFKTKIEGFNKAIVIRPFIGSIPFIAYIFEVNDTEKFDEYLKSNADLNWNICTSASDLETVVVDNYVFIVMSPESFDEE